MTSSQNGRGPHTSSNPPASKFFEKTAPGLQTVRRSTPDSEAMASSDDDHDHPLSQSAHSIQSVPGRGPAKPARRSSWLSEVQAGSQRKYSIGSASSLQQNSQPTTPATESGPPGWGNLAPARRGIAAAQAQAPHATDSYPWSGAWGAMHPATLAENVLANATMSAIEDLPPLMSPATEEHELIDDAGQYQFNISYTPVRKNVRSQSYSAGQQLPSDDKAVGSRGMGRGGHRPSRPSMLGEGGAGGRPPLGLVMEDEGDDTVGDVTGFPAGSTLPRTNLSKPDQAASQPVAHPSLLKQAAVENALSKQRSSHSIGGNVPTDLYSNYAAHMASRGQHDLHEQPWMRAHDFAQPRTGTVYDSNQSLASSADIDPDPSMMSRPPHQQPTWSSNLGFGSIPQPSESRRASFADPRSGIAPLSRSHTFPSAALPTGKEAMSNVSIQNPSEQIATDDSEFAPAFRTHIPCIAPGGPDAFVMPEGESQLRSSSQLDQKIKEPPVQRAEEYSEKCMLDQGVSDRSYAKQYFSGKITRVRNAYEILAYPQSAGYNPYAVPNVLTNPAPDLYIVAFKCARAGTFYVPPNTGLEVKVGDMVIVEGDRGVDLGTVTHARITMAEAKTLTQQAKDNHFKWLMMFSRTKQPPSATPSASAPAPPSEQPGGPGSRSQPPNSKAEDRPKMIRSIATNHQIQNLREKEGAEAKAKRVAQVKVGEHGLDMEILDAEMQYDWKKLTFFFYSPKYVNFNNLVIDLFKIYKTRIWMDAITNGTSQAAQDEVLGPARPLVASSQSAGPVARPRGHGGSSDHPTSPQRRMGRDLNIAHPDIDTSPEVFSGNAPYSTGVTSPLQATFGLGPNPGPPPSLSTMPQAGPNFGGSPPLPGSGYPGYDLSMIDPALHSHYGPPPSVGGMQGPPGSHQYPWTPSLSPPAANNPGWNGRQPPLHGAQPLRSGVGPSAADAMRTNMPANNPEVLTEYLRTLALSQQR